MSRMALEPANNEELKYCQPLFANGLYRAYNSCFHGTKLLAQKSIQVARSLSTKDAFASNAFSSLLLLREKSD